MTMDELMNNMHLIFSSMSIWISDIMNMFFENPVTFVMFAIPIVTFLILTVISIIRALFN